ncbi:hypothetical protein [Brevundimonas sp.]|uniref:head-tail joining protein n=1 Tax=Brevundimonas sp. TaxID=1871086 RepID=UPI0028A14A17|nr:hypothetical protein [Brevundimonas sp.]
MNFSDHLAGLDLAIEDHLCDDALYLVEGVAPLPVRLQLDQPDSADRLQVMGFVRSRPVITILKAAVPGLREDHRFQMVLAGGVLGDIWQVAEAPTAPGDGRWWVVEVMPG